MEVNIVAKLNEALPLLPPVPHAARHNARAPEPHLLRVQFQDLHPVILPGSVRFETRGLFQAMREWRATYQLCEAFYEDHQCENLGECLKIHVDPREVRTYFSCYVCAPKARYYASVTIPTHSAFCPYAHADDELRVHPLLKESVLSLVPLFPPTLTLKDHTILQSAEVAPTAGAFRCLVHPEVLCTELNCTREPFVEMNNNTSSTSCALPAGFRAAPYQGTVYRTWVDMLMRPDYAGFEVLGTQLGQRVFWCPSALVATSQYVRVYLGLREATGDVVAVKSYKDAACEYKLEARRAVASGFAHAMFEYLRLDTDSNG